MNLTCPRTKLVKILVLGLVVLCATAAVAFLPGIGGKVLACIIGILSAFFVGRAVIQQDQPTVIVSTGETHLHKILDEWADGILITDEKKIIQSINRAAERVLGFSTQELMGKDVGIIIPASYTSHIQSWGSPQIFGSDVKALPTSREAIVYRKQGDPLPVELMIHEINMESGPSLIISMRDISERRIAESNRRARNAAETANRAKTEFLVTISHELRTPMHAILNYSEMGLQKSISLEDETLKKYFVNILTSGKRLLALLNNLLELSKLESGKMELQLARKNLNETMESCLNELEPLITGKGLQVEITDKDVAVSNPLDHDAGLMMRVFVNVLSNAIKYSDNGASIKIQYSRADKGLRCGISNQGPPIPEADLERIFDTFATSSVTKNRVDSTGLGLAISRQIINLHHGKIWAENSDNWVSFYIDLPIKTSIL